ncbi:hypothetical protein PVK06_036424 [Gossypium arboreum]|uniref:Uncharacterized protein n=1 Tax=Gossypium arboreum TaxID=29729 RepID=A0ABR0NLY8_GOSAR|nr:hypothetical protein PVK06_036424 [Gossypium arboreum]
MSISLSLFPRRCTDCYAFRAGWNLPDKEFCSLRTIIVTAAIYRGFSRRLSCHQVTNFLDLPALAGSPEPSHCDPLCEEAPLLPKLWGLCWLDGQGVHRSG